jgi:hypothetical protein
MVMETAWLMMTMEVAWLMVMASSTVMMLRAAHIRSRHGQQGAACCGK